LSAYTYYVCMQQYGPVYAITATKLDEKPEAYFPLSNPESYGIQAIFDTSNGVEINSEVFSEISACVRAYGTNNVEYSNNYYELHLILGDTLPSPILTLLSLTGLLISSILIIGIFFTKTKSL
jgi:hypothetical protein